MIKLAPEGGDPLDYVLPGDLYGPRYTSYPTALQFHEEFAVADMEKAIARSNLRRRPLSLYIHIPFCEHVCYYCGCNRVVTADKSRAEHYLQSLYKEIDHVAEMVDKTRPVIQLHWGGGTPTYLSDAQMTELMHRIARRFNLALEAESDFSIEVDPRTVDETRLALIKGLGFTRLSIGVQDLAQSVQEAVNRVQDEAQLRNLTSAARDLGFRSINFDLIYGLPRQNLLSLTETLRKVCSIGPDRVSMYAYAHLPDRFKVQRQIRAEELPGAQERLHMLRRAVRIMEQAGYEYIGMDHFARKDDSLARAKHSGDLHRNFQGYTTCRDADLFAFGCSAISKVDYCFWQNARSLADYEASVQEHGTALERGYECSQDDIIRAWLIEQLLCHGLVNIARINEHFQIDFATYFAREIEELGDDGLGGMVEYDGKTLRITPVGRYLVRRVCLLFDRYNGHPSSVNSGRFSRIV